MFFVLVGAAAWGQSNQFIDTVLEAKTISYSQAAYLVAAASSLVDASASETDAMEKLRGKGFAMTLSPGNALNIGEYSYLVMKGFDIPSGLMFAVFPGPRYALKELKARGIVAGSPSPDKQLSGEEALRILGNAIGWKEP